jgi:hypothetical protein
MVRFSSKEVFGKRRFGEYEFTIARGKVKGFLGLTSKTEEGLFLYILDQKGESYNLPAMTALDFCKTVINQASSNKEILEAYVKRKSSVNVVLVPGVSLDSVAALNLTRYIIPLIAKIKVDSIGFRGYVSRAKAMMGSLRDLEIKLLKYSKKRFIKSKEILSEDEIDAVVNKGYSWGRILKKVVTPKALLHDIEYIQSALQKSDD